MAKVKTHILPSETFLLFKNRAVYEIMWKNIFRVGQATYEKRRKRIACWIHKATNTQSGCVTIIAFPQQQWLHERASLLRYT